MYITNIKYKLDCLLAGHFQVTLFIVKSTIIDDRFIKNLPLTEQVLCYEVKNTNFISSYPADTYITLYGCEKDSTIRT